MKKQALLKLFLDDVKENIKDQMDYWEYENTSVEAKVNDIVYTCDVKYYVEFDSLEIEEVTNIEVSGSRFKNIVEFLNKELN